jgi:hypothetical protein
VHDAHVLQPALQVLDLLLALLALELREQLRAFPNLGLQCGEIAVVLSRGTRIQGQTEKKWEKGC